MGALVKALVLYKADEPGSAGAYGLTDSRQCRGPLLPVPGSGARVCTRRRATGPPGDHKVASIMYGAL